MKNEITGITADTSIPYFIEFTKNDKKSYFDLKDGKWQFWGDVSVDESAKLFFERIGGEIDVYILRNFIMEDGKLKKK